MKDGFKGSRIIVIPEMIRDSMKCDALMNQLHITDIGHFPSAAHHRVERLQPIPEYVLIFVANGSGHYWYEADDGTRCEYEVNANQYFILPSGKAHAYWSDERMPWTIYWLHFGGELASYYGKGATTPITIKPEEHSRISTRTNMFEELFHVLHSGLTHANMSYVSSLLHYYLASLRRLEQYRLHATDDGTGFDVVKSAIHYMNENIERRLTLRDIAAYTGYSASHFSLIFRTATGAAPLAYFNRLKIDESCRLLVSTDMKINQICFKVGFDDCYYFSRIFAKLVGMSPLRYRKEHGK